MRGPLHRSRNLVDPAIRPWIDLCLINTPSHVVDAGVLPLSISDHSLIYAIRKAHYAQGVHIRSMKQFNREHYLRDLEQKNWHNVYCSADPNVMWKIWKENLGASYTIPDYYRSNINLRCFPVLYALRTFHICRFCLILLYCHNFKC